MTISTCFKSQKLSIALCMQRSEVWLVKYGPVFSKIYFRCHTSNACQRLLVGLQLKAIFFTPLHFFWKFSDRAVWFFVELHRNLFIDNQPMINCSQTQLVAINWILKTVIFLLESFSAWPIKLLVERNRLHVMLEGTSYPTKILVGFDTEILFGFPRHYWKANRTIVVLSLDKSSNAIQIIEWKI